MGEEAKLEETKAEAKPEEKKEEEKKEEKTEEKKEEEPKPPSPPPPIVLYVDLHCVGCAKKIERTILKVRGVEEVEINMPINQVTVKGIVDPQAICDRIQNRTSRSARILSPLPPAEGESKPEAPPVQVSGMQTVELRVNMHREACAQQLKKKILKMRGVQTVETELSSGKVTVNGTMDGEKLKDYIYQRTRKLAKIVPQPPKEEPKKEEEVKAVPEEKPQEDKKEEKPEEEEKEEEKAQPPPQEGDNGGGGEEKGQEKGEEPKKEGEEVVVSDDMVKKMMYWRPIYVIEQLPPPQLFSDENPNACCIS
ncbi:hypothetical protein QJS10_CPB20g01599 [Acorus calamus]|uniref:HMA domain-containing protein n=1 Tax=Acorus calamus TaxID=4465 RepID=A0AAV9CEL2_ACOCL|nr:hypothetical protein QJS10_CPB20g01599 [Acorus calamus]